MKEDRGITYTIFLWKMKPIASERAGEATRRIRDFTDVVSTYTVRNYRRESNRTRIRITSSSSSSSSSHYTVPKNTPYLFFTIVVQKKFWFHVCSSTIELIVRRRRFKPPTRHFPINQGRPQLGNFTDLISGGPSCMRADDSTPPTHRRPGPACNNYIGIMQ